ncbi:DnaD domain-containing protein [Bacillus sp. 165]|uniref:DnaD domain-containing protein n=1 Tax=Bacillus sp. 165 TaxID=1529117 RepID=UPI001ADAC04D|nr:DnaD domain-containing protein [Bacillus sp. 165]MBO9128211.1 DnaD domain-containing protein [Bacillus sp. 165]
MKKKFMLEWFEQGSIAIPKLLMNNYKKLGLNEMEFMVILHIHTFLECGNSFPTPDEIAHKMTVTSAQCMDIIRSLVQRGFLTIEGNKKQGAVIYESYSLQPLWEKMLQLLLKEEMEEEREEREERQTSLYSVFEKEFGRPLSPFECETLAMWQDQDQHDESMIQAALREAVMSGKLNFRYIDRILFEWKKNGIKTVNQAQDYGKKFRSHQQKTNTSPRQETKYTGKVPFYNWLEQ